MFPELGGAGINWMQRESRGPNKRKKKKLRASSAECTSPQKILTFANDASLSASKRRRNSSKIKMGPVGKEKSPVKAGPSHLKSHQHHDGVADDYSYSHIPMQIETKRLDNLKFILLKAGCLIQKLFENGRKYWRLFGHDGRL